MPKIQYSETFQKFDPSKVENYVDWRLKKNRVEAITRITNFRYITGDLDHTQFGLAAADVMGLDNEGKAWFAVLFGQSYRAQNASIILQNFPNISSVPERTLLKWMEKETGLKTGPKLNGNRLIYGNDTKWNRWKLHRSVSSIQQWLNGRPLYESLLELVDSPHTSENRKRLEGAVSSWQQYGWMSTWLTLQMLYDFFKWDIDNWTLPFKSNWSSYNGIMYIFGREELISTKTYTPTQQDVSLAGSFLKELRDYFASNIDYEVDSFSIESVLCEYRKTAYGPRVKEYTGWTSSELALQYANWKQWWSNTSTDMTPILAGIMAKHPIVRAVDYDKRYFKVTYETGMLQSVDTLYDGMPNIYRELTLPHPLQLKIESLHCDWAVLPRLFRKGVEKRVHPCARINGPKELLNKLYEKIPTTFQEC